MAAAATPYMIDPRTGQPIDPNTGQPIQEDPAFSAWGASPGGDQPQQPASSSAPPNVYGDPYANNTIPGTISNPNAPMEQRYTQNQNIINAQGTELNNEDIDALKYYGKLTPQYQQQMDKSLDSLNQTPGYTPGESGQINTDYSQFNSSPGEFDAIKGDPNAARDVANAGAAGEGAMLNQYQANLGGEVGNYASDVGGATGRYGSNVKGAVGGLKSGLDQAQNFDRLNTAVDRSDLAFDPNATEKQLTDTDVQNMKTAAGTRIGNQYQSAEDQLERDSAAAGNTSPLALAAARARLQHQEAADQGDAELNADIAAKQAQFGRAQGIEGQREGAVQTQAGMQATAGTTEEAAAQAAAGLTGTAGIGAAENAGQREVQSAEDVNQQGIDAANRYGQFSTQTQGDIANRQYTAQNNADTAASGRATTTANMRYGQGVGSQQATSAGAQTVGNARIAGNRDYRSGVQGQEGFSQTGGNQARTNQNQTYATQTGGANQSAASQGQFINGKASFGDALASGAAKTISSGFGMFAKGGIITEPTTGIIAESGPEMVVKIPRYGGKRRQDDPAFREAA